MAQSRFDSLMTDDAPRVQETRADVVGLEPGVAFQDRLWRVAGREHAQDVLPRSITEVAKETVASRIPPSWTRLANTAVSDLIGQVRGAKSSGGDGIGRELRAAVVDVTDGVKSGQGAATGAGPAS